MQTYQDIMNDALEAVRRELLRGLSLCEPRQQDMFKRMYGDVSQTLEHIVYKMDDYSLTRGTEQVARTLEKNAEKKLAT